MLGEEGREGGQMLERGEAGGALSQGAEEETKGSIFWQEGSTFMKLPWFKLHCNLHLFFRSGEGKTKPLRFMCPQFPQQQSLPRAVHAASWLSLPSGVCVHLLSPCTSSPSPVPPFLCRAGNGGRVGES